AMGDQREGEGDREPEADRDDDQEQVLPEGRHVAVEVVDDPVRAEAVVGHAAAAAVRAVAEEAAAGLGESRRGAHAVPPSSRASSRWMTSRPSTPCTRPSASTTAPSST